MLKQQQEEAAGRECTFHPVINHRSDRLMAERSEVLRVTPPRLPVTGPSHHFCSTACCTAVLYLLIMSAIPDMHCVCTSPLQQAAAMLQGAMFYECCDACLGYHLAVSNCSSWTAQLHQDVK